MPLNQTTVGAVRAHLDAHIAPHLSGDVSNYAKNRQRCWLEVEAPLGTTRPWQQGVHSEKLWPWLTKVWESRYDGAPDLGLAIHGPSNISWHRDAAYAKPDAMIINLGPCNFLWERRRNSTGTPTDYSRKVLSGGEILTFDCKHRHAVQGTHPERWSIVLWQQKQFPATNPQPILVP